MIQLTTASLSLNDLMIPAYMQHSVIDETNVDQQEPIMLDTIPAKIPICSIPICSLSYLAQIRYQFAPGRYEAS